MLISIIIPTFNNEDVIAKSLAHLAEQKGDFEVIVVDGGSTDYTLGLAKGRVKSVPMLDTRGGSLLNAGAAVARGEVFLFLRPDSYLSPNALPAIERNLTTLPQMIGGNFHLKFDKDTLFTRWLAHQLKQHRYKGHYDSHSGIFIRRGIFHALGGFQPYKILADYDLARRMEQFGPTIYLPETITLPFQGPHPLKTILFWLVIPRLSRLGVHPNHLRLITPTSTL